MHFRFSLGALIAAFIIFISLSALATLGAGLGWIRSFAGDLVAVIFVYAVLRIGIDGNRFMLATVAFLVGAFVEFGQFLAKLYNVQIANRALRIILGATPDWLDVLAYGIGALIVVAYLELRRFYGAGTEP
ncbi:DUF2809 domain-containing protein [Ochrobactrum sp. RH2CCR150]|uniref:DUF2809 domain-containing protein n=1 Tax=Ochrobactrum sp. RH2CCR150 TaxID=2587044 RepID=UPI0015FB77E2|nr:hypothetical protein [Ochrobactrum sp. RH2CCR150]